MTRRKPLQRGWSSALQEPDAVPPDTFRDASQSGTSQQSMAGATSCSAFEVMVRPGSNELPSNASQSVSEAGWSPTSVTSGSPAWSTPTPTVAAQEENKLGSVFAVDNRNARNSSHSSGLYSAHDVSKSPWVVNSAARTWARSTEGTPSASPKHEIDVSSKGRVASLVEKFQAQQISSSTGARDRGKEGAGREMAVTGRTLTAIPEESRNIQQKGYSMTTLAQGPVVMRPQAAAKTTTRSSGVDLFDIAEEAGDSVAERQGKRRSGFHRGKHAKTERQQDTVTVEADTSVMQPDTGEPAVVKEVVSELLKLDSTLSDDGYNVVAPISVTLRETSSASLLHTDGASTSESLVPKTKRLSMYDWAIRAQDQTTDKLPGALTTGSFADDRTTSPVASSSKTVREIPKDKVTRNLTCRPINIFVGTWNTEYAEFPTSAMLSNQPSSMGEPSSLPPMVDPDVFTTGVRVGEMDSVSENLRPTVRDSFVASQLLGSEGSASGALHSSQAEQLQPTRSVERTVSGGNGSKKNLSDTASVPDLKGDCYEAGTSESDTEGDIITDNVDALRHFREHNAPPTKKSVLAHKVYQQLPDDKEPFADWLRPGYDVYVIALQEVVSDRLFDAILIYLNRVNCRNFAKIRFTEDKISGLGDGAYLSMKSTAIACFVAEEILGPSKPINAGSSKGMSLSSLNGSKGAVSIILTIYNQVICFVSCHLPAGKPDGRLKAREFIHRRLAEAYCGFSDVSPTDVFHHIVWAGDFNLRLQEVSATFVLEYLYRGDYKPILAFDEFQYSEYNSDFREEGFEEPEIQFYPTYKKIVGRGPIDTADPFWLHKDYNVNFKVRWYKGGKKKERVPSWTDRIFKWSHAALRSCLVFLLNTYVAASPNFDTFLLASDHNPVACGLALFPLSSQYMIPPVMFHDMRVKGTRQTTPTSRKPVSVAEKPERAD